MGEGGADIEVVVIGNENKKSENELMWNNTASFNCRQQRGIIVTAVIPRIVETTKTAQKQERNDYGMNSYKAVQCGELTTSSVLFCEGSDSNGRKSLTKLCNSLANSLFA